MGEFMLGAIIGDIIGSAYEWNNQKSKEIVLFSHKSFFTDDSVMTFAIAKALMTAKKDFSDLGQRTVEHMQDLGRQYPNRGYGGHFAIWLKSANPQPYNSYGNGAGMRVSPVAYVATSLEMVKKLSKQVTEVTHNHPEGIKAAEAIAVCTYMALHGKSKLDIKRYVQKHYYPLKKTLNQIRPNYEFDVTAQGSTPEAIQAFLESNDFEDAIRNAISIGGDSDTIAAMTGAIAGAFYKISEPLITKTKEYLTKDLILINDIFLIK